MKLFSSFCYLVCATLARPWGIAFGHKENHLMRSKYIRGEGIEYTADYGFGIYAKINNRALLEMQGMNATQDLITSLTEKMQAEVKEEIPCAWGLSALGGELTFKSPNNIAFPDLNSNYWITTILIKDIENSQVVVTGKMPEARYFSFQTYAIEDLFSTTIGALNDDDIISDSDGSFTIFVNDGDDMGDPTVNSLRGLPKGQTKGIIVLMYRTYIPVPFSSPAGGVELPRIAIERFDKELHELAFCGDAEPEIDEAEPAEYNTLVQVVKSPADTSITWSRPVGQFTPLPNEDIAYLVAGVPQVKGYAVVVRGKAPTFEDDSEPAQVRYWSVCKVALPRTATISCIRDDQAFLDSELRYVMVVAPEEPSGDGFDYLNFGPGPIGAVVLRNMLPSEGFYDMSVQNVGTDDDDDTIRDKMGEFYPQAVYCSVSRIEEDGVEACF